MAAFDLVVRGGTLITPGGEEQADVAVLDGRIATIGALGRATAATVIEARGLHVLPGVIDTQVHFREPGLTHKEDFESGTHAAVKGGVTAIFDMPNTKPAIVDEATYEAKFRAVRKRSWCDFALYVGATPQNADQLAVLEQMPACAGIKVFMGSSTGDLLVPDDEALRKVLASGRRRVAVHCEDDQRLKDRRSIAEAAGNVSAHPEWRDEQSSFQATSRLLALARLAGRRVHVLHVTTGQEIDFLIGHRDIATIEVTPQHLSLVAPDCYAALGTRAQMNPPIRDVVHQERLWRAIADGLVDVLGSDHAPHTIAEKSKPYPESPSGMPGVQTLVPLMLDHVAAGRLTLRRFTDLTAAGPARAFGIARKGAIRVGYDGDFTIVDLQAKRTITADWLASRCGWSPFEGRTVTGWPVATIIRGRAVMLQGEVLGEPAGHRLRFTESTDFSSSDRMARNASS
ncbi:MAG: dihydroorotase [Alphaproteobacteria bacterium]|nr:dihydroorotase [Alphaproteobacteria bacterium]